MLRLIPGVTGGLEDEDEATTSSSSHAEESCESCACRPLGGGSGEGLLGPCGRRSLVECTESGLPWSLVEWMDIGRAVAGGDSIVDVVEYSDLQTIERRLLMSPFRCEKGDVSRPSMSIIFRENNAHLVTHLHRWSPETGLPAAWAPYGYYHAASYSVVPAPAAWQAAGPRS